MKIAIVGATGLVGSKIISLCEKYFSHEVEYSLFASKNSAGKKIKVSDTEYDVIELCDENIGHYDIALFSAGGERSKIFANKFIENGSYVVDNSSSFRLEENVPLVVYGINQDEISSNTKLISNPNCTTMRLVMALKPLHDLFELESIVPVAYQAVSGSGTVALNSLEKEISLGEQLTPQYEDGYYTNPIAKNVIPLAGSLTDNGYSDEEMKFVNESRKILKIHDLIVEPSNARVGVVTGHGTFCSATFKNVVDIERAKSSINGFDGTEYWDSPLPTPLDVEGREEVLVSRLREGLSSNKILNFWVVSDNLLKGAALNAVQIAKYISTL